MKLGLSIGYSGAEMKLPLARIQRAEELGYDCVWTAEAYGSDAISPLAYIAGQTHRIKLGTGIMQLAARSPANAAMSAATIDALAGGGRFIAGLGVSGPQIVEGWYGEPWGRPYYRLKDYVEIMRKIFKREEPVVHDGKEIRLPYDGADATGVGKPLKSILHMNPDIPIYIGSGNAATVRLTAEICDGWLPLGLTPSSVGEYLPWLEEGFERARAKGVDKGCTIYDRRLRTRRYRQRRQRAHSRLKPEVALYVGGMGHRNKNFPQGYDDAARLWRRRRPHSGTLPRRPQTGGNRRRAR